MDFWLEFRAISEISAFRSDPVRSVSLRLRPVSDQTISAIGQKVPVSDCASCTGLVLGEHIGSQACLSIYLPIAVSGGVCQTTRRRLRIMKMQKLKKRPNRGRCISRCRRILKTQWVMTHCKRRGIGRSRHIVKTHWVAQTHCNDALGGADALRRRIGYLKDHGG